MPFDVEAVRLSFPGRPIEWSASTASTMLVAARAAAAGCPSGAVFGADEQTAGQGRLGRSWHSEPDAGLYFSLVLRLNLPPARLPIVTLALGLAVAEAVSRVTDIACDLRWPNDVMVAGRKCCGILAQLDNNAVIAGIGVNVNHASFPEPLAPLATSLRIAGGRPVSRESLLAVLLASIDTHTALVERAGPEPILAMFSRASSYISGRRVTVEQDGRLLTGTTAGLDPSGFLFLLEDNGRRTLILNGGVRPA